MDDPQLHRLVDLDLQQRLLERLDGTGDVALDDEVERGDLALLESAGEVLERDALAGLGQLGVALGGFALLGDLARGAVLFGHDEHVTRTGHRVQTLHLDRPRRSGLCDLLAVLVDHGAHAAVGGAGDDGVSDPEGSGLDQHRRDRTATLVELGLDRDTAGVLVRVRTQVETRVGGEQHRIQKVLDARALPGRHVDEHHVAAVLLRDETVLGELLAHPARVRVGLVDLVDGNDDRNLGGLGVVQGLHRLGHDAVVGGDHEDREVGHLRTTGTHGGERLVTRGVDEGDRALDLFVLGPHLIGADVLRDAAGLALGDVRLTDRVEKARLTVVDVAHDGHDGRTDLELVVVLFRELLLEVEAEALEELLVLVLGRYHLDLVAELIAEHLEGGLVEGLRRGGHLAQVEQDGHQGRRLHRVAGELLDLVREVGDRCAAAHADDLAVALANVDAADLRRIPHLEFLTLRPTRLALLRLAAALAEGTGCAAAAATAATAGPTGETAAGPTGETATGTAAATGTTGAARTLLEGGTAAAATGTTGAARTRGAGTRRTGTRGLRTRDVAGVGALPHALRRRERVVSGTRARGTLAHALRRRERVVARAGRATGTLIAAGTLGAAGTGSLRRRTAGGGLRSGTRSGCVRGRLRRRCTRLRSARGGRRRGCRSRGSRLRGRTGLGCRTRLRSGRAGSSGTGLRRAGGGLGVSRPALRGEGCAKLAGDRGLDRR